MKYLKVLFSVSVLAVLAIASCEDTSQNPVIEKDKAPGAPTGVTSNARDGEVTVNWTAPVDKGIINSDGSTGVITKYTVYWGAAGVDTKSTQKANVNSGTTYTITTGLTNGTPVYFIVTAWNATGESAPSDEESATPSATVVPVTGVTITEGATANVVMGNTLQLTANILPNNADQGIIWSSSDDTIATVSNTGLVTPKSSDSVTITVTSTADNTKTATIVVTVKEANRAPGKPTVTATAGNREVTVTWTAPSDLGIIDGNGTPGVITKYTVYWGSSENGATGTDVGTDTTYTITNLANGTQIVYFVTAWNATGESEYNTPQSITPSATKIDVDSVAIDNGATADVFTDSTLQLTATVLPNDASNKGITWRSSDDNIATVSDTGLVEPVSANNNPVRITATSTDDSTKSAFIDVTVKEANRAPGKPTGITATAGNQQVTVDWTVPGDPGITGGNGTTGVIDKYTVYWGTSVGVTPATAGSNRKDATGGATTTLDIDSLTNGTKYYFIVTARNAAGESENSDEVSATPATVPGAPTNVQASAGNTEVTVSWEAPIDTGGATITGYTVYWRASTGVTTADNDDSATVTGTNHTITGLTNGTEVFVIVTATNSVDEGAASGEASATPATVPGAPTNVQASAGNGEVTVSWTAPADTGGATITGYTVYWKASTGVTTADNDGSATVTGTSHTITGLSNGTEVFVIVTATNSVDEGAPSSEESATLVKPNLNTQTFSYTAVETPEGAANADGVTPAWDGNPDTTGITYSITGTTATTDGRTSSAVQIDQNTGKITITATAVEANSGDYTVEATADSSSNYVGGSTQIATATVNVIIYAVGETGPAGGKVFYDEGDYTKGWRYLEAAPSDEKTKYPWGADGAITGGTQTGIGSGETNTDNIVATLGTNGGTAYAAKICAELDLGGKDDWFLPSKDELDALFDQSNTVGGFSSFYYWSSSEDGSDIAWIQRFGDGTGNQVGDVGRRFEGWVRAVRAF